MTPEGVAADEAGVAARGVAKSFDGVVALDAADLDLRWGEVHALLGENGAGKTTLSNILAGIYRADAGTVVMDGVEHEFRTPAQAIEAGVGMVHQHFKLVAPMTVAENIHLGWHDAPALITTRELVRRTRELGAEIGMRVDPAARVYQLSVGEQQRVEILRVLARGARLLILDEPTAVLTAAEADDLFSVMRRLTASGRTVVFISHKLNEVLEVADRITVLRAGRTVATLPREGATVRELARLMTGQEQILSVEHRDTAGRPVVIELSDVTARGSRGLRVLHGVSLAVRAGEVLGLAGVSGNGQTELAEVITGLSRVEGGRVAVAQRDLTNAGPRAYARAGVGHIPEDRVGVGLIASAPVRDNAVLRHYRTSELSGRFSLRRRAIVTFARRLVDRARVQTPSVMSPISILSGGNQQRLTAHREALVATTALVAVHPTRGLDVHATQEVQTALLERRDQGCAVVLISDDLDEVLLLADRIAVMYEGRIIGEFDRRHADREHIGLLMGGHAA